MGFTYNWQNALDFIKASTRDLPIDKINAQICDAVSSEMWSAYPWKDACQTLPEMPLTDGEQHYDAPQSGFKLIAGQILKSSPDAEAYEPLTVVENIPIQTLKRPPVALRRVSLERGEGRIRLDFPPDIQTGDAYVLTGVYQLQHRRIEDVSQETWFKDQLWHIALDGLLKWGYQLADRAKDSQSQYAIFRNKLKDAWMQEDQGSSESIYPADGSIGADYGRFGGW